MNFNFDHSHFTQDCWFSAVPFFPFLSFTGFLYTQRTHMLSFSYLIMCLQLDVCGVNKNSVAEALRRRLMLIFKRSLSMFLLCMCGCGCVTLLGIFFCAKAQFSSDILHLFVLFVPLSSNGDVSHPRQSLTPPGRHRGMCGGYNKTGKIKTGKMSGANIWPLHSHT